MDEPRCSRIVLGRALAIVLAAGLLLAAGQQAALAGGGPGNSGFYGSLRRLEYG